MNEYIYIQICNPPILIHYGDWIRARHQPLNSSWNEHWRVIEVPWRAHFLVFRMDSRNPIIGILYPCNIWVSPSISPKKSCPVPFRTGCRSCAIQGTHCLQVGLGPTRFQQLRLGGWWCAQGTMLDSFWSPKWSCKGVGWWDVMTLDIYETHHNTSTWLWVCRSKIQTQFAKNQRDPARGWVSEPGPADRGPGPRCTAQRPCWTNAWSMEMN